MKGTLLEEPAVAVDGTAAGALHVAGLSDSALQQELAAEFAVRRRSDARIARLSGEVVSRSRPSLGPQGLATRNGNTDAAEMVAQIGRITRAEAGRLCRVGDATAIRSSFTGEVLPPTFPAVYYGVRCG